MYRFLIIFIIYAMSLCGQSWRLIDSVFAPMGVTAQSFSAPFFADMDRDGKSDLFMGSSGNRVEYFSCLRGAPNPAYVRDTGMLSAVYANGYQFTNAYYPVLADLDSDNDYDLVISGYNGLLYYKNAGDSSYARWEKQDTMFAFINTQIGTDAKPAFVDIDKDGDLDLYVGTGESLFGGPTPGITMAFRNTGTRFAPAFTYDAVLSSGIMDVGRNAYHTFADLDKDGDYDMLIGRDLATFVYYKNVGNALDPVWQNTSTLFAGVETTRYWKDPVLHDLDGDGDYDLIYGTDAGLLYVYENTGTPQAPAFTYNASFFKIIKLDANASTVSFADYDKDGDYDFISGSWLGKVNYFQNTGNSKRPAFAQTAMPFTNLTTGSYNVPVFVDLDKDGDQDIVSGNLSGKLTLFVNTNGTFSTNSSYFSFVNVSGGSYPAFADLDGDGDYDLLVGAESSANTVFYRNDGNGIFVSDPSYINNVSRTSYFRPSFADLDNDSDMDLIVGSLNGSCLYYVNSGDGRFPVWTRNDTLFKSVKVNQNSSPGLADLDGDGRKDLVVGEYNGNFTFFKNLFAPSAIVANGHEPMTFRLEQNYPNPFNPSTKIRYSVPDGNSVPVRVSVYDALGKEVSVLVQHEQPAGIYEVEFVPGNVSAGMYVCIVAIGDKRKAMKMLYLR